MPCWKSITAQYSPDNVVCRKHASHGLNEVLTEVVGIGSSMKQLTSFGVAEAAGDGAADTTAICQQTNDVIE